MPQDLGLTSLYPQSPFPNKPTFPGAGDPSVGDTIQAAVVALVLAWSLSACFSTKSHRSNFLLELRMSQQFTLERQTEKMSKHSGQPGAVASGV